jgi:2-polyprenyl-6-methoxyphenol hydroxylase-like FAD-dependent oxidoreductase
MRRIAVVGSGIAGLLTAHGLRRAGHEVTVYSDRTGRQWLEESKPTGAACRFDRSLEYDRELGLSLWEGHEAMVDGISLLLCARRGNRLLNLNGRFKRPAVAADVRWLSERWMAELEQRGGRVVVEKIDVERLEAIAAQHDLTVVAVGRADLCRLFPAHAARSVYTRPQRNLAMAVVRGHPARLPGEALRQVRFNVIAPDGEAFFMPYLHKDGSATWVLALEPKPGSRMDRFTDVTNGEDMVVRIKEVIRDLFPWDAAWAEPFTLADPNGWLVGAITPTVRDPVGKLPSGRLVTGVGDTLMALDPIGGQGANNGTRMARHLVQAVNARGDRPFDAAWMTETFESFWDADGRHTVQLNNLLLEPMTVAGRLMLFSQYGSNGSSQSAAQRLADAFTENFNDPRTFTPALRDPAVTRQAISSAGDHWAAGLLRGAVGVARGQLRQALGKPPGHPTATA